MVVPAKLQKVTQVFSNQFDHVEDHANENKENPLELIAIEETRTLLLIEYFTKELSSDY